MAQFKCVTCGVTSPAEEDVVGSLATCPNCGSMGRVLPSVPPVIETREVLISIPEPAPDPEPATAGPHPEPAAADHSAIGLPTIRTRKARYSKRRVKKRSVVPGLIGYFAGAAVALLFGIWLFNFLDSRPELLEAIHTLTRGDPTPEQERAAVGTLHDTMAGLPFNNNAGRVTEADVRAMQPLIHDMLMMTDPDVTPRQLARIMNKYWPGEGDYFLEIMERIEQQSDLP